MSQYSDSQLPASSIAGTNLSEEPNVTTDDTRSDDVETENSDCPKKEEGFLLFVK
jgi:hypothetical protein